MIIYHGITTYHILQMWLHKVIFHPQDKGILILPDFIKDKFPAIAEQLPKNVFDSVILFPYRSINNKNKEDILPSMDKLVKQILPDIDFHSIEEINVAGAQYYFAYWLIHNNISFNFFEEASGRLSKPEPVIKNVHDINLIQYEIAMENGLFTGENPLVNKRICNLKAQISGFNGENVEDFNIITAMEKITAEERIQILNFFKAPSNLRFPSQSAVLLTQHFANLKMMSFEEQAVLYQLTVDYYLQGRDLFIKTHPDDLMFYKYIINPCTVIEGRFPSELLPFISETPAETIATISSTGISNISYLYNNILSFDTRYEHSFLENHKYYLAAKIAERFNEYAIWGIGINDLQLENMLTFSDCNCDSKLQLCSALPESSSLSSKNIFFIGNMEENIDKVPQFLHTLKEQDIAFFFNSDKRYCFYQNFDKSIFSYIMPKKIKIEALDKSECEDIAFEYVFIFTKNDAIRRDIADMHYTKVLINSGIETTVPEMVDTDIQIAALKGILEATERRLLFCLKNQHNDQEEQE